MLALDRIGKTYPNGVRALDGISLRRSRRARSSWSSAAPAAASRPCCGRSRGLDTPPRARSCSTAPSSPRRTRRSASSSRSRACCRGCAVADNVGFGLEHYPRAERARARCAARSIASASPRRRGCGRASCPAARRSASPSRARWCRGRRCCCSTSRSPRSTPLPAPICRTTCSTSGPILKPTLVMVTHDVEEAIVLADRIMVMRPHPGPRLRGDRVRPAAPARPAVRGLRFRQAPRARRARPLARSRHRHRRRRDQAGAGRRHVVVDSSRSAATLG